MIDPALALGPDMISESAVLELTILAQYRAVLQRRVPAPDFRLECGLISLHSIRHRSMEFSVRWQVVPLSGRIWNREMAKSERRCRLPHVAVMGGIISVSGVRS